MSNAAVYTIPLQHKDNSRTIDAASLLMLVTALVVSLFSAVFQHNKTVIVCVAALLLFAVYMLVRVLGKKPAFAYLNIVLLVVAVYMFILATGAAIFIGAMLALAALFEGRFKRRHVITLSNEGVEVKTSFNTTYTWGQLNNVIIKEGLITVDAKNNKLYQKEVAAYITTQQESEVNGFCRSKLLADG